MSGYDPADGDAIAAACVRVERAVDAGADCDELTAAVEALHGAARSFRAKYTGRLGRVLFGVFSDAAERYARRGEDELVARAGQ